MDLSPTGARFLMVEEANWIALLHRFFGREVRLPAKRWSVDAARWRMTLCRWLRVSDLTRAARLELLHRFSKYWGQNP